MRRRHLLLVWLFLALFSLVFRSSPAQAAGPPTEPILRIETGMHTAIIKRIAVDALGRYLATASDDKTCRVWDIKTGEQLRVLRPPIGTDNEGRLYAVAMSPDARYVFCAGWTGYGWDKSHSVYVFERETGRLVRRLTGLPSVVNHLAISKDGAYLAAVLGDTGVRCWRLSDLTLVGQDTDYHGESYGAAFDGADRLATTCYDGQVRLYQVSDAGLRQLARMEAPGGRRPFGIAFSPDNDLVAVGYTDSTTVSLLDGDTLDAKGLPNTQGVDNGNLASVAFGADGALWAGGRWIKGSDCPIRRWAAPDFKQYRDMPAGQASLSALCALPDGGVAFGTVAPRWGVLTQAGQFGMTRSPAIQDYRAMLTSFLVDQTGETVDYHTVFRNVAASRFALAGRELGTPRETTGLLPPRLQAPGLSVTDWRGSHVPRVNGQAIALKDYESVYSLAVAPDGQRFILGTNWFLRCLDGVGKPLWQRPAPDAVWAVNISGDGRLALAAYGDGTIRWYRMRDGQELLAFFPHADGKRWVLWTPKGYYDASPGGEDLIGWHVNNGPDRAADFFPASRFRETFHRPDVIDRVLATLDEDKALAEANAARGGTTREATVLSARPPVVEIVSPPAGGTFNTREISLTCSVRSPGGEAITAVRFLVDGARVVDEHPQPGARPTDPVSLTAKIPLPDRDAVVSVVAENTNGASAPATVRLKWAGQPGSTSEGPTSRLFLLAIGVGDYADKNLRLEFPAKDAQDFAAAMAGQKGKLYSEVTTRLLTDAAASKSAILDGLDWIERQTTQHDVAMIYLSGHGVNDRNGDYYFLPTTVDLTHLRASGLPFTEIQRTIRNILGRTLVFVDTCHSGGILPGRKGHSDINGVINELASAGNGAVVFAASTGRQFSLERPDWQNGAFTKALVEGLTGRADFQHTGRVTFKMLDLYLSQRVAQLTSNQQTPTTGVPGTVGDFPLAMD